LRVVFLIIGWTLDVLYLNLKQLRLLKLLRDRIKEFLVLEIDLDLAIEGRLKESFDGGLIFGIEETSGPFGG